MKTIVYLAGFYSFGFALFHIGFWKLFQWKKEVRSLSFANKGILQTLNVQLIWFFILVGIICLAFPEELINTDLGKVFLGGNALFWLIRTINQIVFFRTNHYKIHLLTIIFLLGVMIFTIPIMQEGLTF